MFLSGRSTLSVSVILLIFDAIQVDVSSLNDWINALLLSLVYVPSDMDQCVDVLAYSHLYYLMIVPLENWHLWPLFAMIQLSDFQPKQNSSGDRPSLFKILHLMVTCPNDFAFASRDVLHSPN